jgi:hypothetical protein
LPLSLVQRTQAVRVGWLPGSTNIVLLGYKAFGKGFGIVLPAFHMGVSVPSLTPTCTIQFFVAAIVKRMPVLV